MSKVMKFLFVLSGFCLAVVVFIGPSVERIRRVENKARVFIGDQIIVADIAETAVEREKGLAGRKYLATNEGMLFVYEEKDYHSLWMKGMYVPIDVIWISGSEIIGFKKHILPELDKPDKELTVYVPPGPVDKFLELRGGRISLLNVRVGDTIRIETIVPIKSE
jgi:uncharacterized membrane protein (UPF0127 family)